MKIFVRILGAWLVLLCLQEYVYAQRYDYQNISDKLVFIPSSEALSSPQNQALSASVISLYMAQAAQKYNSLLQDSNLTKLPLEDRSASLFVTHPYNEKDTLYQIDVRIYSPSLVGRRYNRMVIIRPYNQEKIPCVLYTHGNGGNLNTWYNYYMIGVPSLVQRGYAVAFYENYNNSFFVNSMNTDEVYRKWVHENLSDSTEALPDDYAIQRGYFLLYQYGIAAYSYLSYIADEFNIDKNGLFTAGHSAGGVSTLLLSLADPRENFQHPLFDYCGDVDSRVYSNIKDVDRLPIKGVLSSASGLPDVVEGSYFGDFLGNQPQDKAFVMIHGAVDDLAPVDYGKALWGRFVDTVKLMGPLTLHQKFNDLGVKNYSFINCTGGHGVYTYPYTPIERSGVFRYLSPFSYDYSSLTDEDFLADTALNQILLHYQQMDSIMGNVAKVFSRVYDDEELSIPSGIYTWQASNMSLPITLGASDGYPVPTDCSIPNSKQEDFVFKATIPTQIDEKSYPSFKVYPNPSSGIFYLSEMMEDEVNLDIIDVSGRIVRTFKGWKNSMIDLSSLDNGIYWMSVYYSNNHPVQTQKLLIQK